RFHHRGHGGHGGDKGDGGTLIFQIHSQSPRRMLYHTVATYRTGSYDYKTATTKRIKICVNLYNPW
ncbi:hypothetical protein, partial [Bacteroides acidifaciens]|uniref:hypothetical protein n=1 Tax=Bacteroides acidifaciens TaxID=85831 RepID=UPI00259A3864